MAGARNVEHVDNAVMYATAVTVALHVRLFAKDVLKNVLTVQTRISAEDVIPALTVSAEMNYSAVTVTPAISVQIMSVPVEMAVLLVP